MIDPKLNRDKSNRILIIHTDGNSYNNPSLKCIIDLLLKNGYTIDLRYPSSFAPMPATPGVKLIPYGNTIRRIKRALFDRFCLKILMYLLVWIENLIYYKEYQLIIGVDRQGLLEADLIQRMRNVPYIYISFEISFAKETSDQYKRPEILASENISYWIVQDEERAAKLKEEHGLRDINKFLLPLASAGSGGVGKQRLRDNLGVPEEKKVAIAIGSFSNWSMMSGITQSVRNWPDNWVLILHERYGRTSETLANEHGELESLVDKKIFISNDASELVDDMSMILSGIDLGLAFYKPDYDGGPHTGDNLKYLGLASGKISTYLRYGVPVVVNKIGLYADEISINKIGAVVNGPDEISSVLGLFESEDYGTNAKAYFANKLDFNNYEADVLSIVNAAIVRS